MGWSNVCWYVFHSEESPRVAKECGINLAPQDPLILAMEKDQRGGCGSFYGATRMKHVVR